MGQKSHPETATESEPESVNSARFEGEDKTVGLDLEDALDQLATQRDDEEESTDG